MPDNSFDVVSLVEMPEVVNAIQQAVKEITTRYDLKDSKSDIKILLGHEASLADIQNCLSDICQGPDIQSDDQVLIFFSGQARIPSRNMFSLLPIFDCYLRSLFLLPRHTLRHPRTQSRCNN